MFIQAVKDNRLTMLGYIRKCFIRNPEDSEDVLQMALTTAYKKLDRFTYGKMKPWLYKIVTRKCINYLRDENAVRKIRKDQLCPLDKFYSLRVTPEIDYEANDEFMIAFNELKDGEQSLLSLHAAGFKYREIAEILDIENGTVMSGIYRAREKLRKNMRRNRV